MRKISLLFLLVIGTMICVNSCETKTTVTENPTVSNESLISRGEYLVNVIGCGDCHSPKKARSFEFNPELHLSGHPAQAALPPVDTNILKKGWLTFNMDLTAFVGPWGISYAANITGHETGIGNWSEEQFKKALTQGKWKGMDNARILLPPMPWQNYRNMKDEDVKAIYLYLKSTKGVNNIPPPPSTL